MTICRNYHLVAMAGQSEWNAESDGFIHIGSEITDVAYHASLNVLLITTKLGEVKVFDVASGNMLQASLQNG